MSRGLTDKGLGVVMLFGIPIVIALGIVVTSAAQAASRVVSLVKGKTYAFRTVVKPALSPVLETAMKAGLTAGGGRFITTVTTSTSTVIAYQQPSLADHEIKLNTPVKIQMGGPETAVELTYLSIEEVT